MIPNRIYLLMVLFLYVASVVFGYQIGSLLGMVIAVQVLMVFIFATSRYAKKWYE